MTRDIKLSLYKAFHKAFVQAMSDNKGSLVADIYEIAINSEAPSWFCSYTRALQVLKRQRKVRNNLQKKKYEMLEAAVKKRQRCTGESFESALEIVINSPAPSFFISEFLAHKIMGTFKRKYLIK